MAFGLSLHPPPPFPGSSFHPTPQPIFYCVALVMSFSPDALLDASMTLVRLRGTKSLRDPLVSQLVGEWVAHSPLAKARWAEATLDCHPSLIRNKLIVAVKQYAALLFPIGDFGLLMQLNIPKTGFRHISKFMTRRGAAHTAATGLKFPRPIPPLGEYLDTWKELAKPLELGPPVSVAEPPGSGRSWPLRSWVQYLQSRPPLVDTIDWPRPLTFIQRGDAYPCAGGSWTQLAITRETEAKVGAGGVQHHESPHHCPHRTLNQTQTPPRHTKSPRPHQGQEQAQEEEV